MIFFYVQIRYKNLFYKSFVVFYVEIIHYVLVHMLLSCDTRKDSWNVCMYIGMVYVGMYVCTYVCVCVCMYVYVSMYVCMYVCVYACVCMYVCICVCVYVGMYVYVCVYVYIFLVYLQHVPLQRVILHAWKDHRTRFTLYTFPSYFRLIPLAVCVLFGFLDL